MARKEKQQHKGRRAKKQPHCRQRSGAAGEPVPRLGAAPARGRRACTSRLRNRGVTGQAQTVGPAGAHKNRCDCCPPAA